MTNSTIHAIIFDFDGTILETEVPDYRSWQEVYAKYGGILPLETWLECVGGGAGLFDPYAYLEEQTGVSVDRQAIREWRAPRLSCVGRRRADPCRRPAAAGRMPRQGPSTGYRLQFKPRLGRRLSGGTRPSSTILT